jgi:UDP-N-acetylglucosamine--N-acetylmuramyl-(pentapeptide) pyrophosphoryl-undecaprenol N-acetylglucosamine transferase
VSVPPCRAAAGLGIPVFTHESDLSVGLATRLNARVATKILVSYEETAAALPPELRAKAVVVGNPIRGAIKEGSAAKGRAILKAPAGKPIVFFIGGSQGARQVNELVAAILPELTQEALVVHQTGEGGSAAEAPEGSELAASYRPYDYIREEMPHLLAAADLIVGRAGAGSLWEAGALGKPMVLIPLAGSGTRGDQVDNARLFSEKGAAKVLVGGEAKPAALLEAIRSYLSDPEARLRAGEAARGLAGANAAGSAAALILKYLEGRP